VPDDDDIPMPEDDDKFLVSYVALSKDRLLYDPWEEVLPRIHAQFDAARDAAIEIVKLARQRLMH
jgi:hypothetical protein